MQGKLLFAIASATILLSGIALAEGRVSTSEWDFELTAEKTFKKNRCSRGYSKLKKILKNEAKDYCARQGSFGKFKSKWWKKIDCVKHRDTGKKTTVTVKGSYRALCK